MSGSIGCGSLLEIRMATNRCHARRGFDGRDCRLCSRSTGKCSMECTTDVRMYGSNSTPELERMGTLPASLPAVASAGCRITGSRSSAARCCAVISRSSACSESWRLQRRKFERCGCPNPVWRASNETLSVPRLILRSSSRRSRSCIWVKFIVNNLPPAMTTKASAFPPEKPFLSIGLYCRHFVKD